MVSSTPRTHFTPGKDPVPIVQEVVWAPGQVWTGGESRPYREFDPGPSSPQSVAIPSELPGPHKELVIQGPYVSYGYYMDLNEEREN